jgi:hypothetical protein
MAQSVLPWPRLSRTTTPTLKRPCELWHLLSLPLLLFLALPLLAIFLRTPPERLVS